MRRTRKGSPVNAGWRTRALQAEVDKRALVEALQVISTQAKDQFAVSVAGAALDRMRPK